MGSKLPMTGTWFGPGAEAPCGVSVTVVGGPGVTVLTTPHTAVRTWSCARTATTAWVIASAVPGAFAVASGADDALPAPATPSGSDGVIGILTRRVSLFPWSSEQCRDGTPSYQTRRRAARRPPPTGA